MAASNREDECGRMVERLARQYLQGSVCEAIVCECLIEVAQQCQPDTVWRSLPEKLRPDFKRWMLDQACQASYAPELVDTESFARLCAFLRAQSD